MDTQNKNIISQLIKNIYPIHVLVVIFLYFLGAGISHFIGSQINWLVFSLGLFTIICLNSGSLLLNEFFDRKISYSDNSFKDLEAGKHEKENGNRIGKALIASAFSLLSAGCVFVYYLIIQHRLTGICLIFLTIICLLAVLYSVPPFKLSSRGYGEVILAFQFGVAYPTFAYLLQENVLHRLVPMITIPLFTLGLATIISTSLPGYMRDLHNCRKTFLVLVNWKNGLDIHNWLLMVTYASIGMAIINGLPSRLILPLVIGSPLGLLSIYEGSRIRHGNKPRWSLLLVGGLGSVGCTIISTTFALWGW